MRAISCVCVACDGPATVGVIRRRLEQTAHCRQAGESLLYIKAIDSVGQFRKAREQRIVAESTRLMRALADSLFSLAAGSASRRQ